MKPDVTRREFFGKASTAAAAGATVGMLAAGSGEAAEGNKPVKILGICCSPRQGKTTAVSLKVCLEAAADVDSRIETELIELAGLKIDGSLAAGIALEPGQKDDFPSLMPKLADERLAGIIIGTPVYFGNMSSLCKAFIERCMVFRKEFAFSDKVGGVVAVGGGRNGGQELTIRSVHNCLLGHAMMVVGDGPPTGHFGGTVWSGHPGGVTEDEFGMKTVRNLGRRVAEVALQLARGAT